MPEVVNKSDPWFWFEQSTQQTMADTQKNKTPNVAALENKFCWKTLVNNG